MLKTTVINLSKKSKRVILLLSDIAVIILSYYLVMLFQYASHTEIIETFIKLPLVVFIYVVSLIIFKMYSLSLIHILSWIRAIHSSSSILLYYDIYIR